MSAGDAFGSSAMFVPDVDGNGVSDILVSAKFDDSPSISTGAAYLILLDFGVFLQFYVCCAP